MDGKDNYLRIEVAVRVAMFDNDGDCVNNDILGSDSAWMKVVENGPAEWGPEAIAKLKERLTQIAVGVVIALDQQMETNGYIHLPLEMYEPMLLELKESPTQTKRLVMAGVEKSKDGKKRRVRILPGGVPDNGHVH